MNLTNEQNLLLENAIRKVVAPNGYVQRAHGHCTITHDSQFIDIEIDDNPWDVITFETLAKLSAMFKTRLINLNPDIDRGGLSITITIENPDLEYTLSQLDDS